MRKNAGRGLWAGVLPSATQKTNMQRATLSSKDAPRKNHTEYPDTPVKTAGNIKASPAGSASSIKASLEAGYSMENAVLAAGEDLACIYPKNSFICGEMERIGRGIANAVPVEEAFRGGISFIIRHSILFAVRMVLISLFSSVLSAITVTAD